ncbi:MAG: phage minor head protein, partial [Candidatus Methanoperedens sp.]|nr:phage minor head protein [Candidatus Methanoperedens sp.]
SAAEAAYLNRAFDATLSLNLRSPEAEAWIEKYAASEIKYIDATSKQAIKQIILKSFQEGITSKEQAKLIKPYIGLTPRQATALENYTARLVEQDISSAMIDKLTETYSNKLLDQRAWNIAITEGHTASNEGFRAQNADAVERGILVPEKYERAWLVTDDDRLCDDCADLEDARADLPDGTFEGGGGNGPPLHNLCRCTEEVVRI